MEETKNLQEMEIAEEVLEAAIEAEESGKGLGGFIKALACFGIGITTAVILWKKLKNWRKKLYIKWLEKDGYVVTKIDEGIADEVIEIEESEVKDVEE